MPAWMRREHVVTTVEYEVPAPEPWGATWDDVQTAITAAIGEYNRRYHNNPSYHEAPSSDSIRVHVADDKIVISFVVNDFPVD